MPRKEEEIKKSRSGVPISEEAASKLISRFIQEARVYISLPEAEECCSNCGAKIRNMPLSGAEIRVTIE